MGPLFDSFYGKSLWSLIRNLTTWRFWEESRKQGNPKKKNTCPIPDIELIFWKLKINKITCNTYTDIFVYAHHMPMPKVPCLIIYFIWESVDVFADVFKGRLFNVEPVASLAIQVLWRIPVIKHRSWRENLEIPWKNINSLPIGSIVLVRLPALPKNLAKCRQMMDKIHVQSKYDYFILLVV